MVNFYTDTIQHDPRYTSTACCKDLDMLEPVTRAAVQAMLVDAAAAGTPLVVVETFRSKARQTMLFNQHATELRTVGVHNYGLAADITKLVDGEPSWKGDFSILGVLAKKHGLVWGGDWDEPNLPAHAFRDWDHVQRINVSRQVALFAGSWYPDASYMPTDDLE